MLEPLEKERINRCRRMIYLSHLSREQWLIFHCSYDTAWQIANVCMQLEFFIFVRAFNLGHRTTETYYSQINL